MGGRARQARHATGMTRNNLADWISFFDSNHPIYVNARHSKVHAGLVAAGIERYLARPDLTVLDYGCGEALYAERLAARTGRLILCEAAPHLRERLQARFAGDAHIAVVAPEAVAALPDRSFDVIVMHSVAQYLTAGDFTALLALFRRLLRADGRLIVGDVVRPDVGIVTDARALLALAAANGFFIAALFGLMRTALSGYRKLRQRMGLTRYSEADMLRTLKAAGFSARRAAHNIGHNQARMTFEAAPVSSPQQ
ncbi:MAG: hypothetical protein GHHEDOFH_02056 [Pseudorhodoplanes sp.]|nr:hypothetical protein [Pseudorhodoplanes sp.]